MSWLKASSYPRGPPPLPLNNEEKEKDNREDPLCTRVLQLGSRFPGRGYVIRKPSWTCVLRRTDDPTRLPAVLIQLPTPTSILVKEIASGLVRIALETAAFRTNSKKLLEESTIVRQKVWLLCKERVWRGRVESVEGDGAYYDGCKSLSCGGKGGGKRE
ncbi:unnamed protein product [Brassica oleracea var. botrytis]|uniref:Uncharacterized protein n=3 Tax=Brassica TaxID=3705 RepID=A0A0D3AVW1_BRAOL|nr:unnamed protein product [Brassica napus]VDD26059.1 unnamed protein product [Brassica oleracea]